MMMHKQFHWLPLCLCPFCGNQWESKPFGYKKELNVGTEPVFDSQWLTNTHIHQTPPPTTNQSGATHIVAVCKCRHTRRERRGGCREDFLEDNVGVKDRGPHPYTTEGLPLSLSVLHLLWVASCFPSGMETERERAWRGCQYKESEKNVKRTDIHTARPIVEKRVSLIPSKREKSEWLIYSLPPPSLLGRFWLRSMWLGPVTSGAGQGLSF